MSQTAAVERDQKVPIRRSTAVWLCALPALGLGTLCLAPFLGKAFLIDDPHFLQMARQIVKSPLQPMDFQICWNVVPYCLKAYQLTPGNTLMGYALVPTVLGGAAEWMAHVTQLVFVWCAALAMASFVLRLGWSRTHAAAGALLLVAIPPLLPMASTAMPDVLALAVALVAMERLAAWKVERKWHQGVLAALALGLAGAARAHLALLLPVAGCFLLESFRPAEVRLQIRRSPALWLPVAGGAGVLALFIYATRTRGLLLDPPSVFTGVEFIGGNLRSYLQYLCFPLPLALCWTVSRWRTQRGRILALLAGAALAGWIAHTARGSLVLISAWVLGNLLLDAWRNRDPEEVFLLLWILLPLPIVYYGHLPIKYLLPCMPAVILFCFRLTKDAPLALTRALGVLLIVGGTAYSMLILRADAEFANFGREALTTLVRPRVLAGETVWYPTQFSAYWYASLAGGQLMVPGSREPAPGDLVAVGIREELGGPLPQRYPRHSVVGSVAHQYRFGRTMWDGAGLYTNVAGKWLWTYGSSPDDRYELWRIE